MNNQIPNGHEIDFDTPAKQEPEVRDFDSPAIVEQSSDLTQPQASDETTQLSQSEPMYLIGKALEKGADIETLGKLMDLQERHEAKLAKRDFDAAYASFMEHLPSIENNKNVYYETKKGVTNYNHATLDYAIKKIAPALAAHKLSYHWECEQSTEGNKIKVTCFVSHASGHYRKTSMIATPDESAGKNHVQSVGSTVTYLKRYTLFLLLGIASGEDDTDGIVGEPSTIEYITDENLKKLKAKIAEKNRTIEQAEKYVERFYGAKSLDKIRNSDFADIIERL